MKKKAPIILSNKLVASSSLFHIESIELLFSNGEKRIYERLKPTNRNAVMIVPINQNKEIILIKEYAVGTESYELGFPKGLIDLGESPIESANRELKEEIGYGAKKFVLLKETKLAPSYFSSTNKTCEPKFGVVFARSLEKVNCPCCFLISSLFPR